MAKNQGPISTLFFTIKLAIFQMWLFIILIVEFQLIIFNATPPHQSTSGHTVLNWLFPLRKSDAPVNLSSHFLAECRGYVSNTS